MGIMGLSTLEVVNGLLGNDFKKIEAGNEERALGLAQARRAEENANATQENVTRPANKTQAEQSASLMKGGLADTITAAPAVASSTTQTEPPPAASGGLNTQLTAPTKPSVIGQSLPGAEAKTTPVTQESAATPIPTAVDRANQRREITRKNGDTAGFDKATQDYVAAVIKEKNDATDGAMSALMAKNLGPAIKVYNKYVHDGNDITKYEANKDGSYKVFRTDGSTVDMTKDQIGGVLAGVKNGSYHDQLLQKKIEAQDKAYADAQGKGMEADLTGQKQKNIAEAGKSTKQGDYYQAEASSVRSGNGRNGKGGSLTLAQERTNAEVDAARKAVAGMTPQEIAQRTLKTTKTGRENPDYDPNLDRKIRIASTRKIGDDEEFDQQGEQADNFDATSRFNAKGIVLGGKPIENYKDSELQKLHGTKTFASPAAKAKIDAELTHRTFVKDSAMKGNSLGELTSSGYKVIDSTGKHIGYYAR